MERVRSQLKQGEESTQSKQTCARGEKMRKGKQTQTHENKTSIRSARRCRVPEGPRPVLAGVIALRPAGGPTKGRP